jgi:hypothetical protein
MAQLQHQHRLLWALALLFFAPSVLSFPIMCHPAHHPTHDPTRHLAHHLAQLPLLHDSPESENRGAPDLNYVDHGTYGDPDNPPDGDPNGVPLNRGAPDTNYIILETYGNSDAPDSST